MGSQAAGGCRRRHRRLNAGMSLTTSSGPDKKGPLSRTRLVAKSQNCGAALLRPSRGWRRRGANLPRGISELMILGGHLPSDNYAVPTGCGDWYKSQRTCAHAWQAADTTNREQANSVQRGFTRCRDCPPAVDRVSEGFLRCRIVCMGRQVKATRRM